LADYSAGYGYSATYFGKLFHRVVGVSFSEYLVNARINQAKILLKTSEMSVSQIAYYLGYCDVSYFTRQFKKIVGCPPNSFR
jgi:YesN/AraC family two-component response regulator